VTLACGQQCLDWVFSEMAEIVTSNAGALEYVSPLQCSLQHVLELVFQDAVCEVSVHWLVAPGLRMAEGGDPNPGYSASW